jgi:predicted HicB family RNase H-like nuclease
MDGAVHGIRDLVADVVNELRREKSPIPSPIAAKRFSGAFKVRIPPMIHQRLAVEAAEQGVSLNRLVSAKLSA